MSQRNKNWQETRLKKQQQQKKTAVLLIVIVVLACVGGIGYTIYDNGRQAEEKKAAEALEQEQIEVSRKNTDSSTVNVDAVLDYLSGLDTELLNEDIVPESQAATQEAADAGN